MKRIIYKKDSKGYNSEMKALFLQSMDHFDKYYWTISTITSNTEVYQKLLQNKSKIGEIYIKDYQKGIHNSRAFHKTLKGNKHVHIVSKRVFNQGEYSIHSKFYLFYTSDKKWRCFVGSFNLTDDAFDQNIEMTLCIDSESPGGALFLQDVWNMFDCLSTSSVFREKEGE